MKISKEQLAQKIAEELAAKPPFTNLSVSQLTAIFLFGGRKEELEEIAECAGIELASPAGMDVQ